jgi:hypothetical protein
MLQRHDATVEYSVEFRANIVIGRVWLFEEGLEGSSEGYLDFAGACMKNHERYLRLINMLGGCRIECERQITSQSAGTSVGRRCSWRVGRPIRKQN